MTRICENHSMSHGWLLYVTNHHRGWLADTRPNQQSIGIARCWILHGFCCWLLCVLLFGPNHHRGWLAGVWHGQQVIDIARCWICCGFHSWLLSVFFVAQTITGDGWQVHCMIIEQLVLWGAEFGAGSTVEFAFFLALTITWMISRCVTQLTSRWHYVFLVNSKRLWLQCHHWWTVSCCISLADNCKLYQCPWWTVIAGDSEHWLQVMLLLLSVSSG